MAIGVRVESRSGAAICLVHLAYTLLIIDRRGLILAKCRQPNGSSGPTRKLYSSETITWLQSALSASNGSDPNGAAANPAGWDLCAPLRLFGCVLLAGGNYWHIFGSSHSIICRRCLQCLCVSCSLFQVSNNSNNNWRMNGQYFLLKQSICCHLNGALKSRQTLLVATKP